MPGTPGDPGIGETFDSGTVHSVDDNFTVEGGNNVGQQSVGGLSSGPRAGSHDAQYEDMLGDDVPTMTLQERQDREASQAQARAEEAAEAAAEQAAAERAAAELAAKQAEMEAAHDRGEAYHWGETEHNGETVDEWILPDGTTILVDDDGQAVSVEYPPGVGPEFQGEVAVDGEMYGVYEMPSGVLVVIDENGDLVGELDDIEPDTFYYPVPNGGFVEAYAVPAGEPNYSTAIYNANTDEVLILLDTGSYNSLTNTYVYQPAGADYEYVLNADGDILYVQEVPPEKVWGVLGIVEYYDDGTVSVDLGVLEIDVDVIGPEQGISLTLDIMLAEGTVGVEWEDDGSWSFVGEIEADVPGGELDASVTFGQDGKGNAFFDVEGNVDVQLGLVHVAGGLEAHFQQTDNGFEAMVGMHGEVSAMGFYLERDQSLAFVFEDGTATMTYTDMIGAGIQGLGGIQFTGQTQVRTDGTWGGTGGALGSGVGIVDSHGNELLQGAAFVDSEGNAWTQSGLLDDGRDYDRDPNEIPKGPGDDAAAAGFDLEDEVADERRPSDLRGDRAGGVPRDVFDDVMSSTDAQMDASTPKLGDRLDRVGDAVMDVSTPKLGDRIGDAQMDASTPKLEPRAAAGDQGVDEDLIDDVTSARPGALLTPGGEPRATAAVIASEPVDEPAVEIDVDELVDDELVDDVTSARPGALLPADGRPQAAPVIAAEPVDEPAVDIDVEVDPVIVAAAPEVPDEPIVVPELIDEPPIDLTQIEPPSVHVVGPDAGDDTDLDLDDQFDDDPLD